jgi:DNA-binding transcriptional ArsR family regulator
MSVDKIFEALSSAPRRRILAYLSKTDMTAGEIAERFVRHDVATGHLQTLVGPGETPGWSGARRRGMNVHYGLKEDALTGTLVHFLAESVPALAPVSVKTAWAAAARKKKNEHMP